MTYVVKPFRAVGLIVDFADKRRCFFSRFVVHALACGFRDLSMQGFISTSSRTVISFLSFLRFRSAQPKAIHIHPLRGRYVVQALAWSFRDLRAARILRHAKAWTTSLLNEVAV